MHFFGKINIGFKYQRDFKNSKINKKRYKWQVLLLLDVWNYDNIATNTEMSDIKDMYFQNFPDHLFFYVWHKRFLFPKTSWPFLPLQLAALKQLNCSENLHQIFPAYSRAVIPKRIIRWMTLSATFSSYEIVKVKIRAKFSLLQ